MLASGDAQAQSVDVFVRALSAMAALTGKPLLYGPNGKPLTPSSDFTYRRDAAKNVGSFKNWRPQAVFSNQTEAMERAAVVERSIDLANNDPHAAGIIDNFACTVIGSGLTPVPAMDRDAVPEIGKDAARAIHGQMRSVYNRWAPYADAGLRMHDGMIQYLEKLSLMRYGEFFKLLPMIQDPQRPYMLACQLIHPLRVRTPIDKVNDPRVRDGIELGEYGQAVAAWVKKSGTGILPTADVSANFLRIPFRRGHRVNLIHGFVVKEPEQVRGWPFLAPAMKYLRDLNDLLSAELVSNVVTAALTYFIETAGDPLQLARNLTTSTTQFTDQDGNIKDQRYQETYPGAILYGNTGEKPHLLAAARPGVTFEPFVKTVKKSISMVAGIPYVVNFKDVENTNFAGFRSAMLDAWRVFEADRLFHARISCQPVATMLMEEAWLRGEIDYPNTFYRQRHALTRCEWRGAPKGDIEPVKAAQADDILVNKLKVKTRTQCAIERGADFRSNVETLEEERELLDAAGLLDDETDNQIDIPDDVYTDGSNGDDGQR